MPFQLYHNIIQLLVTPAYINTLEKFVFPGWYHILSVVSHYFKGILFSQSLRNVLRINISSHSCDRWIKWKVKLFKGDLSLLQGHMSEWYFVFNSMQALDGLYKENMKQDKQQRLDKRKKRLSEMLLKETKEYEVRCKTGFTIWL